MNNKKSLKYTTFDVILHSAILLLSVAVIFLDYFLYGSVGCLLLASLIIALVIHYKDIQNRGEQNE